MLPDGVLVLCGISLHVAALAICLDDYFERRMTPRKLWRAICKAEQIDMLRLRMVMDPPMIQLPKGSGARAIYCVLDTAELGTAQGVSPSKIGIL